MANSQGIHLVRPSQPSKPNLDPRDIASQALSIAKECSEALSELQDYHDQMAAQIHAHLAQLEILALRAIAARGRRS
jgi:hypothetical protein